MMAPRISPIFQVPVESQTPNPCLCVPTGTGTPHGLPTFDNFWSTSGTIRRFPGTLWVPIQLRMAENWVKNMCPETPNGPDKRLERHMPLPVSEPKFLIPKQPNYMGPWGRGVQMARIGADIGPEHGFENTKWSPVTSEKATSSRRETHLHPKQGRHWHVTYM